MSESLDGKTAIVTGSSSGIGMGIAEAFADAGASVVTNSRSQERAESTAEAIEAAGGTAVAVEGDVSDRDDAQRLVEAAVEEFGSVDVMVNNAGIYRGKPLVETNVEEFDLLYRVNVRGVFAGLRAAARDMLDRGEPGRIVNTASISSEYAQVNHAMYDSTKGAVMMLTRVAALELAQQDIRVNAVAPGPIETAIGRDDQGARDADDDWELPDGVEFERHGMDTAVGRSAQPEEIAGAYLFLASDDASFMFGNMVYADGGLHIR